MIDNERVPIKGYEGKYAIDKEGNVYSYHKKKERVLSHLMIRKIYASVRLCNDNGFGKIKYVSHLLLEAFVGPRPSSKHKVKHLDGDKTNLALDNLEWESAASRYNNGDTWLRRFRGPSSKA